MQLNGRSIPKAACGSVLSLVLVIASLSTAPAQTSLWDDFRTRCLIPMQEVQSPITRGLPLSIMPGWWTDEGPAQAYLLGNSVHLVVSAGPTPTCALGSPGDGAELALFDWLDHQNPDYPYIALNKDLYESFEWREPRLQVGLREGAPGGGAFVFVHETDLEA